MSDPITVKEIKDNEELGYGYPLEPQFERAIDTIKELTLQLYRRTGWRQWAEMPEWLQDWMEYHGADLFWRNSENRPE